MVFNFEQKPGQTLEKKCIQEQITPRVSIVTPYYNSGRNFEETYRCIINQTMREKRGFFEVFIGPHRQIYQEHCPPEADSVLLKYPHNPEMSTSKGQMHRYERHFGALKAKKRENFLCGIHLARRAVHP